MKKNIVLLILLFTVFSLYSSPSIYKGITDKPFRTEPFKYKAMGSSGLALFERENSYFINAANLSKEKKFHLDFPKLSLSVYHVSDIINAPFSEIEKGSSSAILDTLEMFYGTSPIVEIDQGLSLSFLNFGTSLDFRESIWADGISIGTNFIPKLDTVLSFGYGGGWETKNGYGISLGGIVHLNGSFYSNEIGLETALSVALGKNGVINFISGSFGFASDLGIIASFPHNINLGFTATNLISFASLSTLESTENTVLFTPPSFSLGLSWEKTFDSWFTLALTSDFVNFETFIPKATFSNILYHLALGASLDFSKWASLYLGLDGGYPTCGIELNLFNLSLTCLYRIKEFGNEVGLNPVDELEIGLTLIF